MTQMSWTTPPLPNTSQGSTPPWHPPHPPHPLHPNARGTRPRPHHCNKLQHTHLIPCTHTQGTHLPPHPPHLKANIFRQSHCHQTHHRRPQLCPLHPLHPNARWMHPDHTTTSTMSPTSKCKADVKCISWTHDDTHHNPHMQTGGKCITGTHHDAHDIPRIQTWGRHGLDNVHYDCPPHQDYPTHPILLHKHTHTCQLTCVLLSQGSRCGNGRVQGHVGAPGAPSVCTSVWGSGSGAAWPVHPNAQCNQTGFMRFANSLSQMGSDTCVYVEQRVAHGSE